MAKKLTPQEIRDFKSLIPSIREKYKMLRKESGPGVDVFNPLVAQFWYNSCEYIKMNYPSWRFKSIVKRLIDKAEKKEKLVEEKSVLRQINGILQKSHIAHPMESAA